jgi:hypothetical protein
MKNFSAECWYYDTGDGKNMNDLIKGLTILKDYPEAFPYAEHDEIYVTFHINMNKEDFDLEDIEDLQERGWDWDDGRWIYYV